MSFTSISAHPNKRTLAFRAVKKCAKENGIDYLSVSNYFKGDFTSEDKAVKVSLYWIM